MSGLRVLVLGAGSIGRRHAENLLELGAEVMVADPSPDVAVAFGARRVDVPDAGSLAGFDGVLIASPSSAHAAQAATSQAAGVRTLVEKPLALDAADAARLADATPDLLAVAFNLRFHAPVAAVAALAHGGALGAVRHIHLWCGSWLPDWRPGTDYRRSYSARRELGGGVLLDAIHEIDLALWLVGGPLEVRGASVERLGDLEIDVEDSVVCTLAPAAGGPQVAIELDYLSPVYRRGVEVVGDRATVRYDWSTEELVLRERNAPARTEHYDVPVARSYELEAKAFLAWIDGGPPMPVMARAGAASAALAETIRRAGER